MWSGARRSGRKPPPRPLAAGGALAAALIAIGLGAAMWVWIANQAPRDIELERSGIRVTATVLAYSPDSRTGSEELSFQLPDGATATQWTGSVTSRQASGTTLAALYLPGRPDTVEAASYLRWWWVGAVMMPVCGTAFIAAGVWLLVAVVRKLRECRLSTP